MTLVISTDNGDGMQKAPLDKRVTNLKAQIELAIQTHHAAIKEMKILHERNTKKHEDDIKHLQALYSDADKMDPELASFLEKAIIWSKV